MDWGKRKEKCDVTLLLQRYMLILTTFLDRDHLHCRTIAENYGLAFFAFFSEIYNYYQHHGLLWSGNFATTVTWRNDFSSLFKASRLSKIIVFSKQRNKLLKWCNVGVIHRCTSSLKSHYVWSYGPAWSPISDVIHSTGGNLIDWKSI